MGLRGPGPARAVAAGAFHRVYDPGQGRRVAWYVNDHTFVRAGDGTWHLFGITHPEPADPEDEATFAHATAPSPQGPWTRGPPALRADPGYGETHLWAPHVVPRNDGSHAMVYAAGGGDPSRAAINLATSWDLQSWSRHPGGPLFRDGFEARDPMVLRMGGVWVLYYCATDDPAGGHHVVAYRTSRDLLAWGERALAYVSPRSGTGGGDTESPFVVDRGDGHYYLFIGPCGAYGPGPDGYTCTDVYRSADPFRFAPEDHVGRIPAHAAEVVRDLDGSWWISHAGWGQGGVWLAPLRWEDPGG